MKPTRPSEVRSLLDELHFRPLKSLGQNFLIDANILAIILDTAAITPDDEILEVGTGLGVLTEPMASVARRVVTVEKDYRLCDFLKERLARFRNVELICADMLSLDHEALLASGINKIVANLPYSVGSAILVNFLQAKVLPRQITITLQFEVARRLIAKPSHSDYGLLSLWSQLSYEVSIRKIISPTCFYPAPIVRSAILNLVRREPKKIEATDREFFFALTKFAFSHRRKQLGTVFRALPAQWDLSQHRIHAAFRDLDLDLLARAEALSINQWHQLAQALNPKSG
ncbi:MAG: ribosomal RNA small subunit methyltransferase A [Verrucomicrobia bacterium]|nr:ribosomal RNA small subunit methyltransferase A [Verrucomicrobiota bacterium]MBU4290523.1 ribosomal RNA small subunit methyltransferase A [Verrucomicrobiota bacterium]MBU4430481.1 ribosomal RNA small subunit methyltransferase A [Verrucomicrobiota bacterium]MBU4497121.1 ribosomal RNA small subunit methyltransferase A [Verrucomicrobiota bacterium]MCG2681333.1 16S rRNA (adenine(1518)-N(6)/adenine(1519)-N(6))-dimethyltransferase RsmA [Kiritimatiellia bacterium]